MKTTMQESTTKTINLIEGKFTTSEAVDIIYDVLDVKINFHKLQRLSKTEGNHNATCTYDNGRIQELIASQEEILKFFNELKTTGKKISIKSTIEISVEH